MRWRRYLPLPFTICLIIVLAGCGGSEGRSQSSSLAPAEVKIVAPQDGATVPADKPVTIRYEANLSPRGDHLHVIVDGGEPAVIKRIKGTYTIGPLSAGEHTVLVTEVTREHMPTGNDASIRITAK